MIMVCFEGLRVLLERFEESYEILEAGDCAEAFAIAERHPDLGLVLLDLGLPDMPGTQAIRVMRERYPEVPVVVVSASEDRATVIEAINCGAMGFIPKVSSSSTLMTALKLVFAKGVYLPLSVLDSSTDRPPLTPVNALTSKRAMLQELGLTPRQFEVLELLVQGLPNKSIGRKLNLTEATVKNHVTAVLRALRVTNRTQAVLAVGQLGYTF